MRFAGEVLDVGDVRDPAGLGRDDDALDQDVLDDLVGNLVDDDGRARALGFGVHLAADHDAASAGPVRLDQPLATLDDAARGEFRPLDDLHQLLELDVRIIDDGRDGVAHLPHVVRGNGAGHAHRDAAGAVDEQVGELPRQHHRLGARFLVVGLKVDGLEVEVLEQRHRGRRHPGLGVSHGRGRVAVDGAEVALLVHQPVADLPVLAHVDEGRVDDRLAVRVVVAGGVAGDLGALAVLRPRAEVQVVHRDQDPPLRRLEPVADVRQRAVHDRGHRVRQVAGMQLPFDLLVYDPPDAHRRSIVGRLGVVG